MVPGVLVTPLGSGHGITWFPSWPFSCRGLRRGQGRELGASGVLSSWRLYWVNCQFSTKTIKTGAASVGLLVRPFVHAELAIGEDFLALLNEVTEILGGLTPYLEVHKSGDLLFVPLSVGVILVISEGSRDNGFAGRSVSAVQGQR